MAEYRDPKVTTTTARKKGASAGRWIAIFIGLVVIAMIIAWWWGGFGSADSDHAAVAPVPSATEGTATTGTGTVPAVPAAPAGTAPATEAPPLRRALQQ